MIGEFFRRSGLFVGYFVAFTFTGCGDGDKCLTGCGLIDPTPGERCGGLIGGQCSGSQSYCNFDNAECGETDQAGRCAEIPELCAAISDPVCGCDGKTYESECVAHSRGVSVRKDGEC